MSRRKHPGSPYQADSRNSRVPNPIIMSQARCTVLTWAMVGSSLAGTMLRPCTTVARAGRRDPTGSTPCPGIGDAARPVPLLLRWPSSVSGTSLRGLGHQLDGRELDGLVVVDPPGQRVAHRHLDGGGDRGHRERDQEAEPVVAVVAAPQHARRRRPTRPGSRPPRRRPPPCGRPAAAWPC